MILGNGIIFSQKDINNQVKQILDLIKSIDPHTLSQFPHYKNLSASKLRNLYTPYEHQQMLAQLLLLEGESGQSKQQLRLNNTTSPQTKVNPLDEKGQLVQDILQLAEMYDLSIIPGFEDVPLSSQNIDNLSQLAESELKVLYQIIDSDFENKRTLAIRRIMDLSDEVDVPAIPGFDGIDARTMTEEDFSRFSDQELEDMLKCLVSGKEEQEMVDHILQLVEELDVDYLPESKIDFMKITVNKLREKSLEEKQAILSELENLLNDKGDAASIVINRIFFLANELQLKELPAFGIDFNKITFGELRDVYSKEDREFLVEELEQLYKKRDETDYIHPLEVLEKYKDGAITEEDEKESKPQDTAWRKEIPKVLKVNISSWNHDSIEEFYEKAKEFMTGYQGEALPVIREYVCDLSDIVFEKREEEAPEEEEEDQDEISQAILSTVETIILPHLEVMERIENRGGQILFSDIWNQPFNDSLKNAVKDRDNWACVICGSDKGLHVHHKIPRKFGGVNHMHNLATLCDSCHPVIETADIKKAHKHCLANYWKNRNKRITKPISNNKHQLKREVEESLDSLVIALSNREEYKLAEEVMDVMKRLEIIFYE
ncbi:HNH endonuclease [Niallia endozanthoxylica]|uniref:HNH endonuclease n=1 Tax=Niallia endozanthoxylica TaxID=2036016 RepID=A0A5J5HM95_9BACI|nr:HNH endonuclease signature motif containing protein [Niallia endozanthoxylica]KAA9022285.1 HNH endonuclease [Niallia endozanthoxylica]